MGISLPGMLRGINPTLALSHWTWPRMLTDYHQAAFDPSKSFARILGTGGEVSRTGRLQHPSPRTSGLGRAGSDAERHRHLGKKPAVA